MLAFILAAIANRLCISPIVGYLLAGVVLGPFTPGFVADAGLAGQLAEIGVILLMFGVGLHFSVKDLLSVRAVAVPGAILATGIAAVTGWALAAWPAGTTAPASCSAWRCRSPRPWWSCARWPNTICSTPTAAASRWAG